MRIGILGGSFNPVHLQHIRMAAACLDQQIVDEVWFVPVFKPVHKPDSSLADFELRCKLLTRALYEHERMKLCRIEQELGGPSYTIITLEELQVRFPQHQFLLIIGGDSCRDLHSWKNIDRLCTMTEFIVIDRPGVKSGSGNKNAVLHHISCELSEVSSSAIRQSLMEKEFLIDELDSRVLFLILRSNLYESLGENYSELLDIIEPVLKELPEGLIRHIEGVAELACVYAVLCKIDPRPAMIAGLAHDLFRIADAEKIRDLTAKAGVILTPNEEKLPMLAHGAAAAAYLAGRFKAFPTDLFEALRWHTSPIDNLSDLARVLVVADTLEPSRGISEHDELRNSESHFHELYEKVLLLKQARKTK